MAFHLPLINPLDYVPPRIPQLCFAASPLALHWQLEDGRPRARWMLARD